VLLGIAWVIVWVLVEVALWLADRWRARRPRPDRPPLHVAHDETTTVVSWRDLAVDGSSRVASPGLVECTAAGGEKLGTAGRRAQRRMVYPSIGLVLAAVLLGPFPPLGVILLLVATGLFVRGVYFFVRARRIRRQLARVREPLDIVVLTRPAQRREMLRGVAHAQKITLGWPRFADLLDPTEVEPSVARALWELAQLLEKSQRVQLIRDELASQDISTLAAHSPAAASVVAQRTEADRILADLGAGIGRRLTSLRRVGTAVEALVREDEAGTAARRAAQQMDAFCAVSDERYAERLATHTDAVTGAFQMLSERYGREVYR
jgi:hypothetical protein